MYTLCNKKEQDGFRCLAIENGDEGHNDWTLYM
jgi:hypothetical protein